MFMKRFVFVLALLTLSFPATAQRYREYRDDYDYERHTVPRHAPNLMPHGTAHGTPHGTSRNETITRETGTLTEETVSNREWRLFFSVGAWFPDVWKEGEGYLDEALEPIFGAGMEWLWPLGDAFKMGFGFSFFSDMVVETAVGFGTHITLQYYPLQPLGLSDKLYLKSNLEFGIHFYDSYNYWGGSNNSEAYNVDSFYLGYSIGVGYDLAHWFFVEVLFTHRLALTESWDYNTEADYSLSSTALALNFGLRF